METLCTGWLKPRQFAVITVWREQLSSGQWLFGLSADAFIIKSQTMRLGGDTVWSLTASWQWKYCSYTVVQIVWSPRNFNFHLTSVWRRPTLLVLSCTDVISLTTWYWAAHKLQTALNCRKEERQIQEKQRWLSTHTVHVFADIFLTVIFQLCVQPDGPTFLSCFHYTVCWGASQNKACICVSHITHTNTYATRHAAAMPDPLWTHKVEHE